MNKDEVAGSFTQIVQDDDANGGNNGEDGVGGIRQAQPVSRDYTFRNNPKVSMRVTRVGIAGLCSVSDMLFISPFFFLAEG